MLVCQCFDYERVANCESMTALTSPLAGGLAETEVKDKLESGRPIIWMFVAAYLLP